MGVGITGLVYGVGKGIRQKITQVVFGVNIVQVIGGGKGNGILCQYLLPRVSEPGQICGIYFFHEKVDFGLGGGIRLNGLSDGKQFIMLHMPSAVRLLGHGQGTQVPSIGAAGHNIGIAMTDGGG